MILWRRAMIYAKLRRDQVTKFTNKHYLYFFLILFSILPLVVADSASSFYDTKINKKSNLSTSILWPPSQLLRHRRSDSMTQPTRLAQTLILIQMSTYQSTPPSAMDRRYRETSRTFQDRARDQLRAADNAIHRIDDELFELQNYIRSALDYVHANQDLVGGDQGTKRRLAELLGRTEELRHRAMEKVLLRLFIIMLHSQ
jgi:hypothetical protein